MIILVNRLELNKPEIIGTKQQNRCKKNHKT